jgi:hypothetical protein
VKLMMITLMPSGKSGVTAVVSSSCVPSVSVPGARNAPKLMP